MSGRPAGADRFLAEILDQPAVMRAAAEGLGRQRASLDELHLRGRQAAGLVLTGMGSSFDACLAAASVLARLGVMATPVSTAELLHFRVKALTAATPVVAVSQSGSSAEMVRLARHISAAAGRPPLVSLTNGTANPLAQLADIAFDMTAGAEQGPSTKTFAATLVMLRALVDAVSGGERFDAAELCEAAAADTERAALEAQRLLADTSGLSERLRAWCRDRPYLVTLGRGTARCAAEMGALILKEAAARHAEPLDTAEFRHGPLELSGPELAAAIISTEPATDALDRALARELERYGAAVLTIAAGDRTAGEGAADDGAAGVGVGEAGVGAATDTIGIGRLHPMLAPAVAVIPLQLLAWQLAKDSGRDPARMLRASKVTTRE